MKWRRTLVLWALLFAPLSIYNIFGNPIFFPTQSTQYQDPKILHYNFSMVAPIFTVGNFSVRFALDKPQTYYRMSARVSVSVDYESYGAYGAFPLLVSIGENGFYHTPNNARIDFVLPPPVPPSGYGAALNGPLPPLNPPEKFDHVIQGSNIFLANFTFYSTGIAPQPPNYGPGYFKLSIGPFTLNITDLILNYSLDVVSELILAALLLPVAHAARILFLRIRRPRAGPASTTNSNTTK
jgi:hypothetical protein